MRKKIATAVKAEPEMPRTPKEAMAPGKEERSEEDMLRSGHYDLEDILRVEELKRDEKRMEYVHKAHDKKKVAMRSIEDLKMASQALASKKKEEKASKS